MTIKREYSILPQGEKDDFHHHVRDGGNKVVTSQYICLFTVITVVIVLILAGVATLTATVFYSDQISATYQHFWYSYESIMPNGTNNGTSASDDSSLKAGSRNDTTSGSPSNSTDYDDQNNKTFDSSHHHHHHHIHHNSSFSDDDSFSESDLQDYKNTTGGNQTGDSDFTMTDGESIINMDELKEKFAETMRELEKHMEDATGIRKAEFVIPIFMLVCFLTLFSAISLCCCIMMRRRDNRRRKLFGKLITDLQTGDSKTVLLNNSDLED